MVLMERKGKERKGKERKGTETRQSISILRACLAIFTSSQLASIISKSCPHPPAAAVPPRSSLASASTSFFLPQLPWRLNHA